MVESKDTNIPREIHTIGVSALIVLFFSLTAAQSPTVNDQNTSVLPDSIQPDTASMKDAIIDTTGIDTSKSSDIDTIITYSAQSVKFTFEPNLTVLTGDAKIRYRTMALDADKIDVLWDDYLLLAEGRLDTIKRDTTGFEQDSVVWKGLPNMKDGTQEIVGREMLYDIRTKRGRVIEGSTEYQDGRYHGSRIKKVDEDVYNIRSGFYTTCDAPSPHYGFWSRDMKLIIKDKVVARPVVLYFGPVPVAIIPFGVFPSRGGRHSGIIVPTYGESASQGRYFTNLGYYWAPSDYFGARGSLDYYERYGILFRADSRYALRYVLNGGVSGSFVNQQRGGRVERRWDMKLNHRHTLSPTANLNVNAYFVSDGSFLQDMSLNQAERLKRQIRSDATLSKRWTGTPYSGTINLNYQEDLETGGSAASIPRISFSRNSSAIIPQPKSASSDDARWWNKVFYSYRFSGENRNKVNVYRTTRWETVDDSTVQVVEETKEQRARSGIQHNISLTSQAVSISYFGVTPRFSYTENWYDEWLEYKFGSDGIVDTVKHNEFIARRTFSGSIGLNTKLYGLFKPKIFGIEALRHTLSPGLSITYRPDFAEPKWKYYDVFVDSTGRKRYYDRFAGNIYGGTPRTEQMLLSIGLNNLFEYKQLKNDKEIKGELFTLGMNTSYNFAADSLRFSDLASSLRLKPFGAAAGRRIIPVKFSGVTLLLSGRHSFYDAIEDQETERFIAINKMPDGLVRLLNFELRTSFKFEAGELQVQRDSVKTTQVEEDRFAQQDWSPSRVPWTAGFNFSYSQRRENPKNIRKDIWGSVNLEIQATKNWNVSYSTRFDMRRKKVVSANISLYRDLHCWEARFVWNPVGIGRGFYLKINVKSAQLQDIKVERREGGGGFLGF